MDGKEIRREFPFFQQEGASLIYFDNGATTQKPQAVIDRLVQYYARENANIHRGSYPLSSRAEELYEHARETVARWLDAACPCEVVFTRGSTEAVNLTACAVGETWLKPGDNIVVTELEHSSDYFPWQHQCEKYGAEFRVAKADPDGSLSPESVMALVDERTRLAAVTAMSNVTGFCPDIRRITEDAHKKGALVFIDASQKAVHHTLYVRELDCDFLCFSGHKMYGPMGIGVLYGRRSLLKEMKPYLYGGDMVEKADGGCIRCKTDPGKYEAGTQNIAGALGLEAALSFLESCGFPELISYEQQLGRYLRQRLKEVPGIHLLGQDNPSTVQVFEMDGFGAYDIGVLLGNRNIAIRCGAHCAYPLMKRMGKESTCRVSLAFYNTFEEVDALAENLQAIGRMRRGLNRN